MKIFLSLALACTGLIALTIACDSASNVTECTVDADCVDVDATFICGEDGICGADTSECEADFDCQVAYNDGDNASATCSADSDCNSEFDEICAAGFGEQGFCVVGDDGSGVCTDSVTKANGTTGEACLDPVGDRTCVDGVCDVK